MRIRSFRLNRYPHTLTLWTLCSLHCFSVLKRFRSNKLFIVESTYSRHTIVDTGHHRIHCVQTNSLIKIKNTLSLGNSLAHGGWTARLALSALRTSSSHTHTFVRFHNVANNCLIQLLYWTLCLAFRKIRVSAIRA